MPVGAEGSLSADEVYAVTAYLLFLNKVIPEDLVLNKEILPKVKMPIGDDYARLPEWKARDAEAQGLSLLADRLRRARITGSATYSAAAPSRVSPGRTCVKRTGSAPIASAPPLISATV